MVRCETLLDAFVALSDLERLANVGVQLFLSSVVKVWGGTCTYTSLLRAIATVSNAQLRLRYLCALHVLGTVDGVMLWGATEPLTWVRRQSAPAVDSSTTSNRTSAGASDGEAATATTDTSGDGEKGGQLAAAVVNSTAVSDDDSGSLTTGAAGPTSAADGGSEPAVGVGCGTALTVNGDGMSAETVDLCTSIARDCYGLPDDGSPSAANMRNTIQKSVQQLAADLYSTDHHFLWEIVQNRYHEPWLRAGRRNCFGPRLPADACMLGMTVTLQ